MVERRKAKEPKDKEPTNETKEDTKESSECLELSSEHVEETGLQEATEEVKGHNEEAVIKDPSSEGKVIAQESHEDIVQGGHYSRREAA